MAFKYEIVWSICKNNTTFLKITQDAVGVDLESALKYAIKQSKNISDILGNEFIEISLYEYKIISGDDVYLYELNFYRVVEVIIPTTDPELIEEHYILNDREILDNTIHCVYPFYRRWLKKNILKIICSLIIAFVICLMFGFSRAYPTFGGEDLIPIGTLFAWGLVYLDSWEKEKNSHK